MAVFYLYLSIFLEGLYFTLKPHLLLRMKDKMESSQGALSCETNMPFQKGEFGELVADSQVWWPHVVTHVDHPSIFTLYITRLKS